MRYAAWVVCAAFAVVGNASAQNPTEPATYGNVVLSSGFTPDPHNIALEAGGDVDAKKLGGDCTGMVANAPDVQLDYKAGQGPLYLSVESDTDTTLVVNLPDEKWACNDDSAASLDPVLHFDRPQAGIYDIWIGTVDSKDNPAATLKIAGRDLTIAPAAPAAAVAANTNGVRTERGRLERGDRTLRTGEYYDTYMFNGTRGDQLVVDLRADDLDPYLIVEAPSGKQFDNDNFEGNRHRSLLSLTLDETGAYEISTTSFQKDETGAYTLTLTPQRADGPTVTEYDGRLAEGDEVLTTDEFVDTYEFVGVPGRHVKIDLSSTEFDSYVMLFSPANARTVNDDSDVANHSIIEADLTEAGTYRVRVTSYEAKEAGAYHLRIERSGAPTVAQQSARDITNLMLGRAATGRLAAGDLEPEPGKYQDIFAFTANAGQNIRVDLTSRDFDTYLTVRTPSGKDITNDDFEASASRSVVDLTLPETGRYQVFVTSYDDKETGNYTVTASLRTGAVANAGAPRAGGTVYGIFVGVSDYGGRANPLRFTDEDPVNARDALIRGAGLQARNAITLTNGMATIANVRKAFSDLAPRVGPNDTFVFFFSGHGSQRERIAGPEPADADGIDETVEFYDAPMIDNEFAAMFDQVHAAASLVILDSCFSGGFAKDLVSKPGRMGLFSSDEDVTSLVAEKFRAGGYLAAFFKDGITDGRADDDRDHRINALELSQYLHERYAGESQVKSMTAVLADSFNYQHLVVDRGGVGPYAVLFSLP